jgi:hypothetical protein
MKFEHVPHAWAKYRIHTSSKYSSQRVFFWRELLDVIEAYLRSDPRVPARLAHVTRSQLYFQAGLELACGGAREEAARNVRQAFTFDALPFGEMDALASRAAGIITNALLVARRDETPDELFDWLSETIPLFPARQKLLSALQRARARAIGEYYLAKAFDAYGQGNFRAVARNVFAGAQRYPAALKNRGVWSITTKSLVMPRSHASQRNHANR